MKIALLTDALRHVRRNLGRFIAMTAIVMLGVSFFVGIRATGPDMRITADDYYDNQNFMDFRLLSTLGFTDEDIQAVSALPGVDAVSAGHTLDVLLAGDDALVLHVMSHNFEDPDNGQAINKPFLLSGRLPERSGECVVDEQLPEQTNVAVGDTLTLRAGGSEPLSDALATDSYTVVGIVRSPLYISRVERGGGTVGSGEINAFIIVPEGDFLSALYTELYLTAADAVGLSRFNGGYGEAVRTLQGELETLGEQRADKRHDQVIAEGEALLGRLRDELDNAMSELNSARSGLDEALQKLNEGEQDYTAALVEYNTQVNASQQELRSFKSQLDATAVQLAQSEAQLAEGAEALTLAKEEIVPYKQHVQEGEAALEALQAQINDIDALMSEFTPDDARYQELLGQLTEMQQRHETAAAELAPAQLQVAAMEELLTAQQAEWDAANTQYSSARAQWSAGMAEYNRGMSTLERLRVDGLRQLEELRAELDGNWVEYSASKSEFDREYSEAQVQLADLRRSIADGEASLRKVAQPQWYVLGLEGNAAFIDYRENCSRIEAIGGVFPLFFFLVAALVSLTTVTRTVDEDRMQMGTLKALGYNRRAIALKHIAFAGAAGVLGGILGLIVGFNTFPRVIYSAYAILYRLPPLKAAFIPTLAAISVCAALASIVLPAALASYGALRGTPASLMQPKAPKPGKRILLENITPLWSALSFLHKVTSRNIFRYKKRLLMTLFGVAGCTALLLTGFGLHNAVTALVRDQLGYIMVHDATVSLRQDTPDGDSGAADAIRRDRNVTSVMLSHMQSADVKSGNVVKTATIVAPQEAGLIARYISLYDVDTGKTLRLRDGEAVLSAKLARMLGVAAGDTLTVKAAGGEYRDVTVGGVAENYFGHYVYVNASTYGGLFDVEFIPNIVYTQLRDTDPEARAAMSARLLENDGVGSIAYAEDSRARFSEAIGALGFVVAVLIVSAAALAFVVLYSLSSINVDERRRELATIKVLGFFDREVSQYVNRESILLSVMGGVLGLGLGYALCRFVVRTAEVDLIMFTSNVPLWVFLASLGLTLVFAVSVCFIMGRHLKSIDMVESLKSVE